MAATRRLQLAAEESGTPALLLRRWRKAGADPLAAAVRRLSPAGGSAARPSAPLPFGSTGEGSAAPAGRSRSSGSAAAPLMTGSWRPPMPRLASLFLPHLAIERIIRAERRTPHRGLRRAAPSASHERSCTPSASRSSARSKACARPLAARRALGAGGAARTRALRRRRRRARHLRAHRQSRPARRRLPEARALGLVPGMPLAKARMLVRGPRRPRRPILKATPPGSPGSACSPPAAGARAPPSRARTGSGST